LIGESPRLWSAAIFGANVVREAVFHLRGEDPTAAFAHRLRRAREETEIKTLANSVLSVLSCKLSGAPFKDRVRLLRFEG
jgi:hypothetical protein